LNFCRKCWYS